MSISKKEQLLKAHETLKLKNPYIYKKILFNITCKTCGKNFEICVSQKDFDRGKYKKHCSRSCANKREHSTETKNKISKSVKHFFKTQNKKTHKEYFCKVCGKPFTKNDKRDCGGIKYCSSKCKHEFLSKTTGGYRKGSGIGKKGWYHGIYCDSTWELAFLIYHLEHNLTISRCKEVRKYFYDNQWHKYYPDFVTDEGIIEIKGYRSKSWIEKEKQNPDIITLYRDDMKKYLDYAIKQYGTPLELLYDGTNPNKILNLTDKHNIWVNNGVIQKCIKPELYQTYIDNGYIHGRLKKHKTVSQTQY